jgi:Putative auto-transporter adhesin, head GIN domain
MNTRALRYAAFSFIASFVLSVVGCKEESTQIDTIDDPGQIDTIIGSGNIVSEQRTTVAFQGVQITGKAKVFITQDSVPSLRVEADDNVINRVTTNVVGGILVIAMEKASYERITVNVYVTMPSVDLLEVTGAGEFVTTLPIQCTTLTCRISGAGIIQLTGSADNQILMVSGTATVSNFGFVSAKCSISISGVANCEVYVTDQLDAMISGVGNIVYDGNPLVIRQIVSGSGSIRPR